MTVVYKNAEIFLAGYEITGDLNQVALTHEAESLDATVFGNTSRVKKGGLKTSTVTGAGFWQAGTNTIDPIFYNSLALADVVAMLFPDGITEGATSTGSGFMLKAVVARYNPGGAVGELLPFTFEVQGRGVGA